MMKVNTLTVAALGAAVMLFGAGAASAAINQVASPGALTGPVTLEDFEDASFQPGFTASGSGPKVPELFLASNATGDVTPSGVQGLLLFQDGNGPNTLFFDFSGPVRSGGLWFGNDDTCCGNPFTAVLDIYSSGGLQGSVSVVANMNDSADQFLGFSTDFDVTRIGYRMASNANLAMYVDDLYFSGTGGAVPEPATWAMMIVGFGAAGSMIRRRKAVVA
jgi:hypothetical protein